MIRTTKHSLKFSNVGKLEELKKLLLESQKVAQVYLDYLWNNGYSWTTEDKAGQVMNHVFDIQNNYLEHPRMLSNVDLESKIVDFDSGLTARLKKCILTQVLGMIGASVEKQRKRLYQLQKNVKDGKAVKQLLKKIDQNVPMKPKLDNFRLEVNSICADFEVSQGTFNGFLQLRCLGSGFEKIRLPVKFHRNNKKYVGFPLLNSFLVSRKDVQLRYELPERVKKTVGNLVGADQGLKDILTFSDGIKTPKLDKVGYSLEDITKKLSRQKKGSRNFEQTQEHRKNFINWSINSLDLSNIKQINLEEIWNIGYKSKRSRYLSHWCNTLIRDKLKKVGEEQGVFVKLQPSAYRSQRCNVCGLVRKSNRKGKIYSCHCGNTVDADLNASLNHVIELPEVSFEFRKLGLNQRGFYWKPEGFFSLTGEALTVPRSDFKTNII